jgi:hypothetical protein
MQKHIFFSLSQISRNLIEIQKMIRSLFEFKMDFESHSGKLSSKVIYILLAEYSITKFGIFIYFFHGMSVRLLCGLSEMTLS